ncbi:MAG: hypothetical protein MHM6MM_005465 [Cercozoa sp. M6MM]
MNIFHRWWLRLVRALTPCCAAAADAVERYDELITLEQRVGAPQVPRLPDSEPVEIVLFVQEDENENEGEEQADAESIDKVCQCGLLQSLKMREPVQVVVEPRVSTFTATVDGSEITLYYDQNTTDARTEVLRVELHRMNVENLWRSLRRWQREHHWEAVTVENVKFIDF